VQQRIRERKPSKRRPGTLLVVFLSLALTAEAGAEAAKTVPPVDISKYPRLRPVAGRPALPVRIVPREVVEPLRDVPASEWRSPYCVKWTDGVEECSRAAATEAASCRRQEVQQPPQPVACLAADGKRLGEICFEVLASGPPLAGRPHDNPFARSTWFWDRRRHAWQPEESQDNPHGDLASFLAAQGRSDPIPSSFTVFCVSPYSKRTPVLQK
jgi:hypothetical protein